MLQQQITQITPIENVFVCMNNQPREDVQNIWFLLIGYDGMSLQKLQKAGKECFPLLTVFAKYCAFTFVKSAQPNIFG